MGREKSEDGKEREVEWKRWHMAEQWRGKRDERARVNRRLRLRYKEGNTEQGGRVTGNANGGMIKRE